MEIQVADQQDKTKIKSLKKLITPVMRDGFQALRMDDIAKLMDVSRATLYKHFSSKEEVMEGVVRLFADYVANLEDLGPEEDDNVYAIGFQRLFEQSVTLAGKISEVFMKELQAVYPELYDELKNALNEREERIVRFYRHGQSKGVFNPINEHLLVLQDVILLREIMNPKYLLSRNISIRQSLVDYYRLKKTQLFIAEKASIVDDSKIEPVIDYLVDKFTSTL
ncbi:TetR/AcrR family transcriptional regulator [Cohnella lupini]|uniref:TetR family transcriptional regulator n=1 Tax=Cohnella lupini TaxID=1294267 RepID=A0A3D9I0A4_9BACL|nr:TetR/AcrR family transcriptional regulator [Cohnella lupini]RED55153.1 TetR family transcriptional regulator [Cohnella lupini]